MNQPHKKHVMRDWAGWLWFLSLSSSPLLTRVITPIRYLNTENEPKKEEKFRQN